MIDSKVGFSKRVVRRVHACLVLIVMALPVQSFAKEAIDLFDAQGLDSWDSHSFEGDTQYALVEVDGVPVLRAESRASASGLVREQAFDLKKTPILTWRWRVIDGLPELDEHSKKGDDYAARIYVIVSGGWQFWKTRALNFVWSGRNAKGEEWDNAFAGDNAKMLALRGQEAELGIWYEERVDIAKLLMDWFGEEVDEIDAIAIMTDTDNSGLSAKAEYAELKLVSR